MIKVSSLILGILCTFSAHAQAINLPHVYNSLSDMVAREHPTKSVSTNYYVVGYGWFVPTNTVTSTNVSTRVFSGISGWSYELVDQASRQGGTLEPINVRTYGAKGDWDGSSGTDDTVAIQAAVTAAKAQNRIVYIPATAKAYKITNTIVGTDNLIILGDGPGSKIIQLHVKNNVIDFVSKTNILVKGIHLVANGNFALDSNPGQAYCGIRFEDCSSFAIEDCTFTASAYAGIYITRGANFTISKNNFPAPGWADPYLTQQQTGDIGIDDSHDGVIENNTCYSTGVYPGGLGIGINGGLREALMGGAPASSYNLIVRNNFVKRKTFYGVMAYNQGPPDNPRLTNELYGIIVEGNFIENVDGSYHHIAEGTNYTGITSGTAAGDGIYMQSPFRSIVRNNTIKNCGLFTRSYGTHVKAGIGWGGTPDGDAINNHVENCWYGGIVFNNSAMQGDSANKAPRISGNTVINCAGYVATIAITNGSTTVYLANPTAPLEPAQAYRALGGFWIGDKVLLTGAGVAGGNLEAEITGINAAAGTLTIDTAASTTASTGTITLSELSGTPPSTRFALGAVMVQRIVITDNRVEKEIYYEAGRTIGIQVQGQSGGAGAMFTPTISLNQVKGGYFGIRVVNTTSAQIENNRVYGVVTHGISSDSTAIRSQIVGNRMYNCDTGIKVNSLDGWVTENYAECRVGIDSTGTEYLGNNQMQQNTIPYNNNGPIRVLSAASNNPSVKGATHWVMNTSVTYTNLQDGRLGEITYLVASNTVTLAHSANFLMRGATDAVLTSGDTIALLRTSATQWKELWRSVSADGWTKSGSTGSSLPGPAYVDSLIATNGVQTGSTGTAGFLGLNDSAGTRTFSLSPNPAMTGSVNLIGPTNVFDGLLKVVSSGGTNITIVKAVDGVDYNTGGGGGGSGDVTGPASSTDTALALFNGTTGKTIQNSGITVNGLTNLVVPGSVTTSNSFVVAGTGDASISLDGSGSGAIILSNASYGIRITANDNLAETINWVFPESAQSGLLKTTKSGTNTYVTNAVSGVDYPSVGSAFVTLTDGATVTLTANSKKDIQNAKVTLGGNRALAFSGVTDGMSGTLVVIQDATGSRTLTLPAGSKVINGGTGAITLTTTANAVDILSWVCVGSNYYWTYGKNFN